MTQILTPSAALNIENRSSKDDNSYWDGSEMLATDKFDDSGDDSGDRILTNFVKNSSPKCEAFVMTGDKILKLNSKISPSYAKAKQGELPPISILETDGFKRRGIFDNFPSMHHKTNGKLGSRINSSISETAFKDTNGNLEATESSMTTMPLGETPEHTGEPPGTPPTSSANQSSFSVPSSPAKHPIMTSTPKDNEKENNVKSEVNLRSRHKFDEKIAASRLAQRLFRLEGFQKSDVMLHLNKSTEFNAMVSKEYMKQFNFSGLRVDAALRLLLTKLSVSKEKSENEKMLKSFAHWYHQCNIGIYRTEDEILTLCCWLLQLDIDLHSLGNMFEVDKITSCYNFVEGVSSTGYKYKRELLKSLFHSIKENSLQSANEMLESGHNLAASIQVVEKATSSPEFQVEYKGGWVMRKCHLGRDGQRMPFGKRGWKMMYGRLRGLIFYLHKSEKGFHKASSSYETFHNAICLHHAWAAPLSKDQTDDAAPATRKQHVFRVRTANMAEFLFQTSGPEEVSSWVEGINFMAALYSAPLSKGNFENQTKCENKKISKYASLTNYSIENQLEAHRKSIDEIEHQLEQLRERAPPLNAKGNCVFRYFYKERYLEEEKKRYQTYDEILRRKQIKEEQKTREGTSSCEKTSDEDFHGMSPPEKMRQSYHKAVENNGKMDDNKANNFLESLC